GRSPEQEGGEHQRAEAPADGEGGRQVTTGAAQAPGRCPVGRRRPVGSGREGYRRRVGVVGGGGLGPGWTGRVGPGPAGATPRWCPRIVVAVGGWHQTSSSSASLCLRISSTCATCRIGRASCREGEGT